MTPRLGSVPYRNVAPLVHGLDPAPRGMVPAALAEALRAGEFDAALVPIAEYLAYPDSYALVDDVAVASRGEVYSVILIPEPGVKLEGIRRVVLDPSSRTSVLLTRVLLEVRSGLNVSYVAPGTRADAHVLIGDPAIAFREACPDRPVLDLGKLWFDWTGLPFVFAAWVARKEAATRELGDFLRQVKKGGLMARPSLSRNPFEERYFTDYIRYDLGDAEKAGILRFAGYLREMGLLPAVPDIHWI